MVWFENSSIGCTQRDKSSFLDLSLFLFFLFTLLKRAILCKSSIKELMIDGISKDYAKSPITLVEIFEEFAGGGRVNFYPSDSMGLS